MHRHKDMSRDRSAGPRSENGRFSKKLSILKIVAILLIAPTLIVLGFAGSGCNRQDVSEPLVPTIEMSPTPSPTPTPIPTQAKKISPGDTLFSMLTKQGIEPVMVNQLLEECRPVYNLSQLSAGKDLNLRLEGNFLLGLSYPIDDEHVLRADFNGSRFRCGVMDLQFDVRTGRYEGVITSSLWEAARAAGIEPNTLVTLSSIYDWEIDFNTELRKDDRFTVLVEEKYLDGTLHHYGRVIAASILISGTDYFSFSYEDPEGRTDYYDQDGKCLRKNFLKAPLQYRRISSGFSSHRMHPILKVVRPHWGVDYAAPTGTPIRAVGDGVILKAGWDKNYGYNVRIKHGSSPYETAYGHMKGFARGIKKNVRVKQGQIIGYVGATGLASGPHLDYRVYNHGSPINPVTMKSTPATEVKADFMKQYHSLTARLIAELHPAGETTPPNTVAEGSVSAAGAEVLPETSETPE